MKKSMACMCMVCLVAWSAGAAAVDRYVSTNGSHTAPFTSWATAATNINAAVNWANTNNAGDTVWVSNGTYVLTSQIFVTNTIVRGFSGDPADVVVSGNGAVRGFYLNHANAVVQYLTISNGLANANPMQYYGGGACVITGTLNHCVLANNTAAPGGQTGHGGGAYCGQDGALITNCVFNTNYTGSAANSGGGALWMDKGLAVACLFSNNASSSFGGGAYLSVGGAISNGIFIGNSAQSGGGAYVVTGVVANCLISTNYASSRGGGVRLVNASSVLMNSTCVWNLAAVDGGGATLDHGLLTNCVIMNNQANGTTADPHGGGGVYMSNSGTSTVANCTIVNNTSLSLVGGGIFSASLNGSIAGCLISSNVNGGVYYRMLTAGGKTIVRDSTISANTNGSGVATFSVGSGFLMDKCTINGNAASGSGGGVYLTGSANTVQYCRITRNVSGAAAYGGGGGVYLGGMSNVLVNCLVANNVMTNTGWGAGVALAPSAGGAASMINCTVVSNSTQVTGYGGGVWFRGAATTTNVTINCIIYTNKAASATYDNWYREGALTTVIVTNSCSTPSLSTYGTGNITNDPKFANAPAGDYHLAKGSPCIDKGLTLDWMNNVTDLDGRLRVLGGMVDMGAYEYVPTGTLIMMR